MDLRPLSDFRTRVRYGTALPFHIRHPDGTLLPQVLVEESAGTHLVPAVSSYRVRHSSVTSVLVSAATCRRHMAATMPSYTMAAAADQAGLKGSP